MANRISTSDRLVFTIYVAGKTPAGIRAVANLKEICAGYRADRAYDIRVIDILENPQAAEDEKVIATPMIVKERPPPQRRLVGDLSDREQVVIELGLTATWVSE